MPAARCLWSGPTNHKIVLPLPISPEAWLDTHAPVLVREIGTLHEAKLSPGMLSPDQFLGYRPPLLPDYRDDTVSVETLAPIVTKIVLIQALEVTPLS